MHINTIECIINPFLSNYHTKIEPGLIPIADNIIAQFLIFYHPWWPLQTAGGMCLFDCRNSANRISFPP